MIACDQCGALAPAASRFCPMCGEAVNEQSHDARDGVAASTVVVEQPEAIQIQDAALVGASAGTLSAREAIPIGRLIMLCVNVALLCILIGLIISNILIPPASADTVPPAPTLTPIILATNTPAYSTATRTISPTPTTAVTGVFPTATPPALKPSATPTTVPTATPDVPPTPIPPTPKPTATLRP